jgi:hypothetical protein
MINERVVSPFMGCPDFITADKSARYKRKGRPMAALIRIIRMYSWISIAIKLFQERSFTLGCTRVQDGPL